MLVVAISAPIHLRERRALADEMEEKQTSPYVAAERWMESRYSPDAKILAGFYSYLPKERFRRGLVSYNVGLKKIEKMRPEVIVFNEEIPGRFIWKKDGTKLEAQQFRETNLDGAKTHTQAMLYLLSRESPYGIVYEQPEVVIFERKGRHSGAPAAQ